MWLPSRGELHELGSRCSHMTVGSAAMARPPPRRGQRSWCEFHRLHAGGLLAVGVFVVDTALPTRLCIDGFRFAIIVRRQ